MAFDFNNIGGIILDTIRDHPKWIALGMIIITLLAWKYYPWETEPTVQP